MAGKKKKKTPQWEKKKELKPNSGKEKLLVIQSDSKTLMKKTNEGGQCPSLGFGLKGPPPRSNMCRGGEQLVAGSSPMSLSPNK